MLNKYDDDVQSLDSQQSVVVINFPNSGAASNENLAGIHASRVAGCMWSMHRERKCADTLDTVPVPWAGHFHC